jgi:phage I-like protein
MTAAATLAPARGVSPLPPGDAPDWVHLLPPPGTITARDGRVFHCQNPAAVMHATAARGLDMVVDFEHASEIDAARLAGPVRAAGWVKALRSDATGIWGRVEWTTAARAMIGAREYRCVSPTLMVDPKTQRIMALRSVALVHHPALPLKPGALD